MDLNKEKDLEKDLNKEENTPNNLSENSSVGVNNIIDNNEGMNLETIFSIHKEKLFQIYIQRKKNARIWIINNGCHY